MTSTGPTTRPRDRRTRPAPRIPTTPPAPTDPSNHAKPGRMMPPEPTDQYRNPASRRGTLALALARGLSVAAAAREARCSVRTAFRTLKDTKFKARVAELRGQLIDQA